MSREVDPQKPKDNADLMYLAERDLLTEEWVEKLGGAEGVSALLSGDKVVKIKKASGSADDADVEEDEEEEEEAEDETAKAAPRTAAAKK